MQTIDEALALYFEKVNGKWHLRNEYSNDWRERIPNGSRWFPGCPGDPSCQECDGTGYLRLDFPVGHPAFGDAFLCSCAARSHRGREPR